MILKSSSTKNLYLNNVFRRLNINSSSEFGKKERLSFHRKVPLSTIEDEEKRVRESILLGFTRDGNHLIGYLMPNNSPLFDDYCNLNFIFFQFSGCHEKLVVCDIIPLLGKKRTGEIPREISSKKNNFLINSFDHEITNHIYSLETMRVHFTQSIKKRLFYSYIYSKESLESWKHIITLMPSDIIIKQQENDKRPREYWGLVIDYFTYSPHSNIFSPVKHVVDKESTLIVPTTTSINILFLEDSFFSFEEEDGSEIKSIRGGCPLTRGFNEIEFRYVFFRSTTEEEEQQINKPDVVHVFNCYFFDIEKYISKFILSGVNNEKYKDTLKNFDYQIIRKLDQGSSKEISFVMIIDISRQYLNTYNNQKEEDDSFRIISFCLIHLEHLKVFIIDRNIIKIEEGNNSSTIHTHLLKMIRFYENKFIVFNNNKSSDLKTLTNDNMFEGKSLEYISHPILPYAITSPN